MVTLEETGQQHHVGLQINQHRLAQGLHRHEARPVARGGEGERRHRLKDHDALSRQLPTELGNQRICAITQHSVDKEYDLVLVSQLNKPAH